MLSSPAPDASPAIPNLAPAHVHSRAVFDGDAPSSKRAIEEFRKENVRSRIYRYAVWRTQSEADADDLVADAMIRVLDPASRPWDPSVRSFERHMRLVLDHIAIERARSGYARFEVVDTAPADAATSPVPSADERLQEHQELSRLQELGDRLVSRLEGRDALAARVFRAACAGVGEPANLARELGCRIEEIYEAMRRLKYHAAQVMAELGQASAGQTPKGRKRGTTRESN